MTCKAFYFITILAPGLFLSGCKNETGDKGDPAPKETGNLIGAIGAVLSGPKKSTTNFRLEHHKPLYTTAGNALVKIEGTNYTTLTNSEGSFTFTGIPTGTYNVSISKSGFGEMKYYSLQILPNENNKFNGNYSDSLFYTWDQLAEISKVRLKEVIGVDISKPYFDGNYVITITSENFLFTYSAEQKNEGMNRPNFNLVYVYDNHSFIFFYSKSKNVSFDNYMFAPRDYNNKLSLGLNSAVSSDTLLFLDMSKDIQSLPADFKSGDTVYVAGYGCNYYRYRGDYYDFNQNKEVYTSLNPNKSTTVWFIKE